MFKFQQILLKMKMKRKLSLCLRITPWRQMEELRLLFTHF